MGNKLWGKTDDQGDHDAQVEAFTVGNDHLVDRFILTDDCWASIAHAAALAKAGILSTEELGLLQGPVLAPANRQSRRKEAEEMIPFDSVTR